ncbi:unnamed protein product [marine sediment metagenome]|uniref:Uncharacterized protein n=1 Tax=marine sediment metagenome TaxID=412755 RepID=X1A521_9ZZZZ
MEVKIRKATPDDAGSISHIWEVVCAERIYTAVSTPFTAKQESEYISSLSEREGIFVAEFNNKIVGFLSLDLWSKVIDSLLPDIFGKIREFDKNVTLINTIFLKYATNEKEHLELESMRDLNIQGINVKYNFATFELFKLVKENGFKFYVWGLLFNRSIQKFLKMNYKGQSVDAMMSNFPDRLVRLRNEIQNN